MCRLPIRRSSPAFGDMIRHVLIRSVVTAEMLLSGLKAPDRNGHDFQPVSAHQASRICRTLQRMPPKDGEIWIRSNRCSNSADIRRSRQNCRAACVIRRRCCAVGMPGVSDPCRNFTSTKMIRLRRRATRSISPAVPRQRRARIRWQVSVR